MAPTFELSPVDNGDELGGGELFDDETLKDGIDALIYYYAPDLDPTLHEKDDVITVTVSEEDMAEAKTTLARIAQEMNLQLTEATINS